MRREFLKSPHHAALAAATLGIGFATGEPLYFIIGAVAYVLGDGIMQLAAELPQPFCAWIRSVARFESVDE